MSGSLEPCTPGDRPLQRLKLTIAYDGAHFRGWQSQKGGGGVQDHIEAALKPLIDFPIRIHGSGRTDAGVHATGQVAHLDVPRGQMEAARWERALNDVLHPAVRILHAEEVPPDFHARMDATGKIYTYRIWNASYLHPLERGRAWMVPGRLDRTNLLSAAAVLQGEHDFAYFCARRIQEGECTRRTLYKIEVEEDAHLITLRFRGSGFLYHMVRMLCGSLVRCAQGKTGEQWLHDLLAQATPEKTRYCAPAEGLYLTKVLYQ